MREIGAALSAALLLASSAAISAQAPAAPSPAAPPRSAEVWGEAYYQVVTADSASSPMSSLGTEQEAGLSLNVRGPLGLELLADIVVPLDADLVESPTALLSQLFVRASPTPGMSISAGRQRLNWGTARVFSAIDLLETRANPLDLRPFLPGVSGLKIDIFPDERMGVSLVALPASDVRWTRAAARLELILEGAGLDLGLGAIKYGDAATSDRIGFTSDSALSIGSVVFYDEAQLRWGRENAYEFPDGAGLDDLGGSGVPSFRAAAGIMLPVDLGLARPLTMLAEYFFNGDGLALDEARSFTSRYGAWQAAGSPAGTVLPDAFSSLGGLRRHYAALALTDIALDRFLLLGVTGICGIDSTLGWVIVDLEWEITQGTSLQLRYEYGHAFQSDQPTDLLFIPFRNRLTLGITTGYK